MDERQIAVGAAIELLEKVRALVVDSPLSDTHKRSSRSVVWRAQEQLLEILAELHDESESQR